MLKIFDSNTAPRLDHKMRFFFCIMYRKYALRTFDHKIHKNNHLQLDCIEMIDFQTRTKVLFGPLISLKPENPIDKGEFILIELSELYSR